MTTNQGEILVKPGEGDSYWVLGDLYTIKARSEDTSGGYGLIEIVFSPQGGAPMHVHHQEDEAFYVLEGEIEFQIEEQIINATPGTFVHVPKGRPHSFANKGVNPAKALAWVAPGGLEKMFMEIGTQTTDTLASPPTVSPTDAEKLFAVVPKYGLELLPPKPETVE
jgi:mannose-6-phosphate isomerase-like protein (cupin superfamily)